MSKKVVIIDYGMGNLHSVNKAVAAVGGEPILTSDADVIAKAEKIILPGVGALVTAWLTWKRAALFLLLKNIWTRVLRFWESV